jgi:hypothetical protein
MLATHERKECKCKYEVVLKELEFARYFVVVPNEANVMSVIFTCPRLPYCRPSTPPC